MRLNKKIFALGAAGLLALTGCDNEEIIAKPTDYDNVLINGVDEEVVNNIESVVIDKLQTSSASEVLDEVLFLLAEAKFGAWTDVKADAEKADFVSEVNERVAQKFCKANFPRTKNQ